MLRTACQDTWNKVSLSCGRGCCSCCKSHNTPHVTVIPATINLRIQVKWILENEDEQWWMRVKIPLEYRQWCILIRDKAMTSWSLTFAAHLNGSYRFSASSHIQVLLWFHKKSDECPTAGWSLFSQFVRCWHSCLLAFSTWLEPSS